MKKITAAVALILVFAGCHKNDQHLDKAVILGYALSNCVCCSGYTIAFGDSLQNEGTVFTVDHLPLNTGIGPGTKFPVKVYIEWQTDTFTVCRNRQIDITALFRR